MVRLALVTDLPRLVEMGQRFRNETPYSKQLLDNPEQMKRSAEYLLAQDGLLVSEREGKIAGMLGFAIFPHPLSGETIAGELFWWVEPEFRGEGLKLLREAEKRAKAKGAKRMQMIAPTEQVEHVYQRFGYDKVEVAYQKTL